MATTPSPIAGKELQTLLQDISKLDLELADKKKKLQNLQLSEIEKLINTFAAEIDKSGFDKVTVKKLIIAKLTRKSKKRA